MKNSSVEISLFRYIKILMEFRNQQITGFFYIFYSSRLPNDLMLNQWLKEKNNLSVSRFFIASEEPKVLSKPCIFSVSRALDVSLSKEWMKNWGMSCYSAVWLILFSRDEGILKAVKTHGNRWRFWQFIMFCGMLGRTYHHAYKNDIYKCGTVTVIVLWIWTGKKKRKQIKIRNEIL